ncbi:hypothetical protein A3D78_03080 [Candidatus Gottesmanbacteria bacterium RIFCSPHIGHO2_02_FULL_39_14]|uniref:AbiEi antitoxin C-terminal domain-containing protein n=1 Tax=Candidatus Gottesmanbacteria bacterium RIFCSPHIGHO2_02_FULL_39_14 TaxID=1798383 RepID=A0A1F5ZZY1_9BACT|nr:MAG: hypothetical protein A3D78_03080 [Candidatus Gottesmanbacteria bacterium RIFCSPHIGHO2_02_FULL_39_14]
MESLFISKTYFINKLREKRIALFSLSDIKKLFGIENVNTLKHLLRRLKNAKIIKRLIKNKYLFLQSKNEPGDFEIANFLVIPSYISLESALSYYGIIDQFSYHISSIILNKPRKFKVDEKTFIYSKINKGYFRDFIKMDSFLIASKEKALFDYCYFIYKGLRSLNVLDDIKVYLNMPVFLKYFKINAQGKFRNFLTKYA